MLCVVCVVITMVVGADIRRNAWHFLPKKKRKLKSIYVLTIILLEIFYAYSYIIIILNAYRYLNVNFIICCLTNINWNPPKLWNLMCLFWYVKIFWYNFMCIRFFIIFKPTKSDLLNWEYFLSIKIINFFWKWFSYNICVLQ